MGFREPLSASPDDAIDVLRFSTAGSVDDGKSSLIGRMLYDAGVVPRDKIAALERLARRKGESEIDLSLLMDGLLAEREQGITIDVAYSYFASPRRKFIIADTPGHEQYTRNMVTGASTADAAVILIDAQRGLTLQTRRHLYLSRLLGVPHLLIAVNKMDLVGYSEAAFVPIARAAADFAAAMGAAAPLLVPVSAKHGDNVVRGSERMPWYGGKPLLALLESLPPALGLRQSPLRLPVQLVQRIPLADGSQARRYLGRVESGRLRPGDEVVVMPERRVTRVRALTDFGRTLEKGDTGMSVAVEVEDALDIARGDMLAASLLPPRVATSFAATICWFADAPFDGKGRYLVKCGTRTVTARIAAIDHRIDIATLSAEPKPDILRCNDIARARFILAAPLAFDAYEDNRATGAFILIDEESNATVAAGMIARREDEPVPSAAVGFDAGL